MKVAVRHSLIAVAILGAVTCLVSLYVLSRLIATNSAQRSERIKDLVTQQLEFQRTVPAEARSAAISGALVSRRPGVRAGYLLRDESVDSIRPQLDPSLRELLARSVRAALSSAEHAPAVQFWQEGDTGAIAGAVLTPAGDIAWTAHPLSPPPGARQFRWLVVTLGLAGIALVIVSAQMAMSVQRGAALLKQALLSLGSNLALPVPRPRVRELSEVADGIAGLASELGRAQSEQARLSRELAERDRLASLGRVAAGVAHEVRNPLAAIKLRVDLVRMDPEMPATVGSELAEVSAEISRLDRLVSDLLVIAGRRAGPRSLTDMRRLADQRTTNMEPWAREHGVAIVIRGSGTAVVDSDAIGRVLDNLIRNAVEASSRNDTVQVEIVSDSSQVVVTVSDHGLGVEPERVEELFEPFFTTKPEGMGLGLALSKAIATAHGGTLTYQRNDGVTRFELELGRRASDSEPPAGSQARAARDMRMPNENGEGSHHS